MQGVSPTSTLRHVTTVGFLILYNDICTCTCPWTDPGGLVARRRAYPRTYDLLSVLQIFPNPILSTRKQSLLERFICRPPHTTDHMKCCPRATFPCPAPVPDATHPGQRPPPRSGPKNTAPKHACAAPEAAQYFPAPARRPPGLSEDAPRPGSTPGTPRTRRASLDPRRVVPRSPLEPCARRAQPRSTVKT